MAFIIGWLVGWLVGGMLFGASDLLLLLYSISIISIDLFIYYHIINFIIIVIVML